jgi:hypothetical protein
MLALAPQILFGLGEEGGEPIFATSSRLKDLSASPRLRSQHTRISKCATCVDPNTASAGSGKLEIFAVLR